MLCKCTTKNNMYALKSQNDTNWKYFYILLCNLEPTSSQFTRSVLLFLFYIQFYHFFFDNFSETLLVHIFRQQRQTFLISHVKYTFYWFGRFCCSFCLCKWEESMDCYTTVVVCHRIKSTNHLLCMKLEFVWWRTFRLFYIRFEWLM